MKGNDKNAVMARQAAHRERLTGELRRMVAALRELPDVRRVVLFGSLSRGAAHSRSDLDLVVIQESKQPFMDRLDALYRHLLPRVPTDLLVYTPAEWVDLTATRRFAERIAKEGIVLYDALAA